MLPSGSCGDVVHWGAWRCQISVVFQRNDADLVPSSPPSGLASAARNVAPQPVDSTAAEVAYSVIGGDGFPRALTALVTMGTASMAVEGSASTSTPTLSLQPPLACTANRIVTLKGVRQREPDPAATPLLPDEEMDVTPTSARSPFQPHEKRGNMGRGKKPAPCISGLSKG